MAKRGPTCLLCQNRHPAFTNPSSKIISFHKFPKDSKIRSMWMRACNLDENTDDVSRIKICSNHFDVTQFVDINAKKLGGTLRLKPGSVPIYMKRRKVAVITKFPSTIKPIKSEVESTDIGTLLPEVPRLADPPEIKEESVVSDHVNSLPVPSSISSSLSDFPLNEDQKTVTKWKMYFEVSETNGNTDTGTLLPEITPTLGLTDVFEIKQESVLTEYVNNLPVLSSVPFCLSDFSLNKDQQTVNKLIMYSEVSETNGNANIGTLLPEVTPSPELADVPEIKQESVVTESVNTLPVPSTVSSCLSDFSSNKHQQTVKKFSEVSETNGNTTSSVPHLEKVTICAPKKQNTMPKLTEEDFATPKTAKKNFHLLSSHIEMKNRQIRALQQNKRRLDRKIDSLKELVTHLRQKNLITEEAEDALMVMVKSF